MIQLARNRPVALIVGAAGFIGSNLVDKFLSKGIQVIGIDNLSTGKKENLKVATGDKDFHFLVQDASQILNITLQRLDYAFFVLPEGIDNVVFLRAFNNFLNFCRDNLRKASPKIVLISSIKLYDRSVDHLPNLRIAEKNLAVFVSENKANARIVRLVSVFGPRMHFREDDPIVKLISTTLEDDLQSYITDLDFTTRSIYIADAVELLIKAVLHGATAHKIFDGSLYYPIKVSEIKQILLDPLWHEVKGFSPTSLPPWPTPNLLRTQKELSWGADTPVVTALKETLRYFRENQADLPKKTKEVIDEKPPTSQVTQIEEKRLAEPKKDRASLDLSYIRKHLMIFLGVFLVIYAIIYPTASAAFGVLSIRYHLQGSFQALNKGDFQTSLNQVNLAAEGVRGIEEFMSSLAVVKASGVFKGEFELFDEYIQILNQVVSAHKRLFLGTQALYETLTITIGEKEGDLTKSFNKASLELDQADKELGQAQAKLSNRQLLDKTPLIVKSRAEDLRLKVESFKKAAHLSKSLSFLLTQVVALDGKKSYLFLLQDNKKLRPGGGEIVAVAETVFEKGKLTDIKVKNASEIDSKLEGQITAPAELKSDFGTTNLLIRDVSSEIDVPTNTKLAQLLYHRATGVKSAGVVFLDVKVLSEISNMDARENFEEALKRAFFVPKKNWADVIQQLNVALREKTMMVYLSDLYLFSYISSEGWTGTFPRGSKPEKGAMDQFLSIFFSNLDNSATDVKKEIDVKAIIDHDAKLTNRLAIYFDNRGPKIKYRIKILLHQESKLSRVLYGEADIKTQVSNFSDFGRNGLTAVLELGEAEKKSLILEYENNKPIEFINNQFKFKLDMLKQPGSLADTVNFKLSHPQNIKSSGDTSFSTNLSSDRSFEVTLIAR